MKRLILLLSALSLLLSLSGCSNHAQKHAAKDILDRVAACDTETIASIMGYDILSLTDIERYTLTRMEYKVLSVESVDDTHCDVTVDTALFDLMTLLNEALVNTYLVSSSESFNAGAWMLEQLNTKEAAVGKFRAVLPLVCEEAVWVLDDERVSDDLRDAITGGAYSWYAAYEEAFGEDAGMEEWFSAKTDTTES